MKKRLMTILALVLVAVFMLAACAPPASTDTPADTTGDTSTETTDEASGEKTVVRVGTQAIMVGTPLDYALKNNMFDDTSIEVERILFPTGAPINEAFSAKQIDIALNGLATVYAVAAGDVTWVGEINIASGMAVYVRPDSPIAAEDPGFENAPDVRGSVETMTGIQVLGPLGNAEQYNASTWMEMFGLTATDYEMLHMDRGPAAQAFLAGEGDAIASHPPYTYQLEDAGMINVGPIGQTSGTNLMDGIAVRNDYLAENREVVLEFMKVIYEAQEILSTDDEIAYQACMDYYTENGKEYTEEEVRTEVAERSFVGEEYFRSADYSLGSVMYGMGEFYVSDGKIDPSLYENIPGGIDSSLISEIYGFDIPVFTPAE